MQRVHKTIFAWTLAACIVPLTAQAEDAERQVVRVKVIPEEQVTPEPELSREEGLIGSALFTRFGVGVNVSGGYKNFVEPGVTDTLTPGGYWDVRGVFGTRSFIGVEAAYHGSAQDVEAIGLQDEAFLVSNGIEGALRIHAPITQTSLPAVKLQAPLLIEPFAFGGVGWQRYSLVNEGVNTSSVENTDDIMTIPLGAGLAFSVAGLHLDARATYRHALFSSLVGTSTSSFGDASLNSWSVGGGLGFEF